MSELETLAERVRDTIPLTRALEFQYLRRQPGELLLSAPLAVNHNDKNTFFAGSQATLFALAGWSLATLEGQAVIAELDVVAVESNLSYRKPVTGDMQVRVFADAAAIEQYLQALREKGRGRLRVQAEALDASGELASEFSGLYLGRQIR